MSTRRIVQRVLTGGALALIAVACSGATFTGTDPAAGAAGSGGGGSSGKGGGGGKGGKGSGGSAGQGASGGSDPDGGSSGSGTGGSSGTDTGGGGGVGGGATGGDSGSGGSGGSGQGGSGGDSGSGGAGAMSAGGSGGSTGGSGGVMGGTGGTMGGVGGAMGGAGGNSGGTGGMIGGTGGMMGGTGGMMGGVGGAMGGTGGTIGGTGGGMMGGTGGSVGGTGNMGGAGGAECESDSDCQLVNDCCSCTAEPKGKPIRSCDLICVISACDSMQIANDEVTCEFGRCVLDRSCNANQVGCETVTPVCLNGTIPSVLGSCWGPCLPPTECREVTNCTDCSDSVCVRNERLSPSYGCVEPAAGCHQGSYCQCLGACSEDLTFCSETQTQVNCACPNCG